MQKVWGKLSDEKRNLIVKALATPKDWTSLWNAVKQEIGSRTTLNVYLQELQKRGTVGRSVDEKRRVTYRLTDPRQEALATKSLETAERVLEDIRCMIDKAIKDIDEAMSENQESSISITDEAVATFKREPFEKFMKPTRRWAKWTVYEEALTIPYFYYMLVDMYLDALMAKDKEIAYTQWNENFGMIISDIRKRFLHIFGLPIRAGLLKEEHIREAIYEWIHEYRTKTKYGEPFPYSKFDPTKLWPRPGKAGEKAPRSAP